MVADRYFPISLVHLKNILRKPLSLAFHWRGSLCFDNDLIIFFCKLSLKAAFSKGVKF